MPRGWVRYTSITAVLEMSRRKIGPSDSGFSGDQFHARPDGGVVLSRNKRLPCDLGPVAIVASIAIIALGGCDEDAVELDDAELRISGNTPTTLVHREDTVPDEGIYPEVMRVQLPSGQGNCTGTVVAPFAVLTASHCVNDATGGPVQIAWDDAGIDMDVTAYTVIPYITPTYYPQWWADLNTVSNNSPWQHDLTMLFVPDLTPEFMAENQIVPPTVDPHVDTEFKRLVGVGSTGGQSRDWVPTYFLSAIPGTIWGARRDGLITASGTTAGFGVTDGGDSGGPTFGSDWVTGGPGTSFEGRRHLVGVTFGNFVERAPLGDPGVPLTPNQELTIRLNAGWTKAAASDPDRDGVPAECDADSTVSNPMDNLCPGPIGGPTALGALDVPKALLTCKDGFVARGIEGRQGWRIDQIAVECVPLSCLERGVSCANTYTTDIFGSTGGSPFSRSCDADEALFGFRARHDSGWYIRELEPMCLSYTAARNELFNNFSYLSPVGNNWGNLEYGTALWSHCGRGQFLAGFEVRSHTGTTVTGLQPVCTDVTEYSEFYGGLGGQAEELSCPESQVAVGTVQNDYNGHVGLFGLLCADEATVDASQYPFDADLLTVHGSYHNGWEVYPRKIEPYLDLEEAASDLVTTRCPTGRALNGVLLRSDTWVNQITALDCRLPGGSSPQYVYPLVGEPNGDYHWARCPDSGDVATGVMLHSGWLTDGLGVRCEG